MVLTKILYFSCLGYEIGRFQNGCNEVAIELRVTLFWTERASRSFDFEVTLMISEEIALHSVQ